MTDTPETLDEQDRPTAVATEEQPAAETAPEAETVIGMLPDATRELQDQLLRLRADFDNFRKRTRREKEEWTQQSLRHVCGDLLSVIDSFDLGLENGARKELSGDVLQGFALVRDQLVAALGKYGLSAIGVAAGAPFDPSTQEAITQVPSDEIPEGGIVAVTRTGYTLGTLLLRPTQVVVSAGVPAAPAGDA